MDPEERTPQANVNVSPDVPSPIFFFLSREHRSHAEATPVTYVRMPVARFTLLERPYQTGNSSAKGFYHACDVPFSFIMIASPGISLSLSGYIDPATIIIKIERADNKYGRSPRSIDVLINQSIVKLYLCSTAREFRRRLPIKKFISYTSFCTSRPPPHAF